MFYIHIKEKNNTTTVEVPKIFYYNFIKCFGQNILVTDEYIPESSLVPFLQSFDDNNTTRTFDISFLSCMKFFNFGDASIFDFFSLFDKKQIFDECIEKKNIRLKNYIIAFLTSYDFESFEKNLSYENDSEILDYKYILKNNNFEYFKLLDCESKINIDKNMLIIYNETILKNFKLFYSLLPQNSIYYLIVENYNNNNLKNIKLILETLVLKKTDEYVFPSLYYSLIYKLYDIDTLYSFIEKCITYDVDKDNFHKFPICYIASQIGFAYKKKQYDELYIEFLERIKLEEQLSLIVLKNSNGVIILNILQHKYGKTIKQNFKKLLHIMLFLASQNMLKNKDIDIFRNDKINVLFKEQFINFIDIN